MFRKIIYIPTGSVCLGLSVFALDYLRSNEETWGEDDYILAAIGVSTAVGGVACFKQAFKSKS